MKSECEKNDYNDPISKFRSFLPALLIIITSNIVITILFSLSTKYYILSNCLGILLIISILTGIFFIIYRFRLMGVIYAIIYFILSVPLVSFIYLELTAYISDRYLLGTDSQIIVLGQILIVIIYSIKNPVIIIPVLILFLPLFAFLIFIIIMVNRAYVKKNKQ
ncbi:MAG: hypothetical protein K8T10_09835 [Candidatus Eremiobacteraeota bacterium]|nr:hypothetical protein [Candidatus Eremiobacteraeota bacterium]